MDGIDIKGGTPKLFKDQLAREHKLNLKASNYYAPIDTTIILKPDTLNVFRFKFHRRPTDGRSNFGDLKLVSEPANAKIKIDGINVRGKTPITFQDQKAGQHKINLNINEKYYPIDTTIYIVGGELNTFQFYFERKKYGQLKLTTKPSGASIELDGIPVNGQTPITFENQKAEEHSIRLEKGDKYIDTTVVVKGGQLNTFNFNFDNHYGDVRIVSHPGNAKVEIDTNDLDSRTPLLLKDLRRGEHNIKLKSDYRYAPLDTNITVNSEKLLNYNFSLKRKKGNLSLYGYPSGANVFIDEEPFDLNVNDVVKLEYGEHKIAINKKGYHKYEKPLTMDIQDTLIYRADLEKKSWSLAIFYSTIIPGTGQRYYGSKAKGWFITLLSAGIGGGLYYLNDQFRTKYELYNRYVDEYEAAKTLDEINAKRQLKDETYTELQEFKQYTYGAAGALGVIWLYNIIDAGMAFNSLSDDTIIMSPYAIEFSFKL